MVLHTFSNSYVLFFCLVSYISALWLNNMIISQLFSQLFCSSTLHQLGFCSLLIGRSTEMPSRLHFHASCDVYWALLEHSGSLRQLATCQSLLWSFMAVSLPASSCEISLLSSLPLLSQARLPFHFLLHLLFSLTVPLDIGLCTMLRQICHLNTIPHCSQLPSPCVIRRRGKERMRTPRRNTRRSIVFTGNCRIFYE